MPTIVLANSLVRDQEKPLSTLRPGNVFRFADTHEAEVSGETTFFMVVVGQPAETGRVTIVSMDGLFVGKRDGDRLVVEYPAIFMLYPPCRNGGSFPGCLGVQ